MYGLLHGQNEIKEHQHQPRPPSYQKPELLPPAPNQVWSWDIPKLLCLVKWTYFRLYVILGILSRCVLGWMFILIINCCTSPMTIGVS